MTPEFDVGLGARSLAHDLLWSGAIVGATLLGLLLVSPWDLSLVQALAPLRDSLLSDLVHDWGTKPIRLLVLGVIVVALMRNWRTSHPVVGYAAAGLMVQAFLHAGLVTNLLKLFVGRLRPLDLGPAGEGFTSFYVVSPRFGDLSFPSGHVAAAMVLAPCVLLLWRVGRRVPALGLGLVTLVWAAVNGYGRVLAGAHFPTDVLASVGLGCALAPWSLRLGARMLHWLEARERTADQAGKG